MGVDKTEHMGIGDDGLKVAAQVMKKVIVESNKKAIVELFDVVAVAKSRLEAMKTVKLTDE